ELDNVHSPRCTVPSGAMHQEVWDHLCEMTVNEQERIKYGLSNEKKDAHILWRAPASDFKHRNLSVLRVFGFHGRRRL
uniref:Uncharacterized protein n=1 Tax=Aegilops tauschii subsp. strangulata TaxID=200361 RepID=A0A453Q545_AEGTS